MYFFIFKGFDQISVFFFCCFLFVCVSFVAWCYNLSDNLSTICFKVVVYFNICNKLPNQTVLSPEVNNVLFILFDLCHVIEQSNNLLKMEYLIYNKRLSRVLLCCLSLPFQFFSYFQRKNAWGSIKFPANA